MHVHLPKPLHGWREFVGEVGIIVVGVLIALAAEQVVEIFHNENRATAARDQLREELRNEYVIADERHYVHGCLSAQIDALEKRVLAAGATLKAAPVANDGFWSFVYRAPSRPWPQNAWQSVREAEVLDRFSAEDRQTLNETYTQLSVMQRLNDEEDNAAGQLLALGKPLLLNAEVRAHFVEILENERRRTDLMAIIAAQIMDQARSFGGAAPNRSLAAYRSSSGTAQFCRSRKYMA